MMGHDNSTVACGSLLVVERFLAPYPVTPTRFIHVTFFFSLPFASPLYRVAYIPGDQNNARRHFSSDTPHSTLAYYHQVKESFEIESQNEAAFPSSFKQKPCNSCVSAVLVHAFHYFPDHRSISYDFPLFFPKNCKWFGVWPWYKHKQGPYNSRPSINR